MLSSPLHMMLARFPQYEETIRLLYHFDDDFASLCEDYQLSQLNADRFLEKITQDQACASEFKNLSETLEQEIIEYVKNRQ